MERITTPNLRKDVACHYKSDHNLGRFYNKTEIKKQKITFIAFLYMVLVYFNS